MNKYIKCALVSVFLLLVSCSDNSPQPYSYDQYGGQQGEWPQGSPQLVVVRSGNGQQVEYAAVTNYDQQQSSYDQLVHSGNLRFSAQPTVIHQEYPANPQQGLYFIRQTKDFETDPSWSNSRQQQPQHYYHGWHGQRWNYGYQRYSCSSRVGYWHYRNYCGHYNFHHYYPTYWNYQYSWRYHPSYYWNYRFYYYAPVYYYAWSGWTYYFYYRWW